MAAATINVDKWIEANKKLFLPPVCNKMMHNCQLKVMYIGGPNIRKDYHHEEGEELFYMKKGDMCLKIVEKGKHKDIPIKEGEVFLLPARIPHSPQRYEDTIGLVIERERVGNETDGLRYYVDGTTKPLFERWFRCYDLGTQLVPIIKEYFASEECRTNVPNPDNLMKELPFEVDEQTVVMEPFSLRNWFQKNKKKGGSMPVFEGKYQFDIKAYFHGKTEIGEVHTERWIWQVEGESTVTMKDQACHLKSGDSTLIPPKTCFVWDREDDSAALCILQDVNSK